MQVTMYFSDEDKYLIDLVDEKARRERKSRSAVMLSILEEYFGRDKRLGEILIALGVTTPQAVERALELQQTRGTSHRIGELLTEAGLASAEAVERALTIQKRVR